MLCRAGDRAGAHAHFGEVAEHRSRSRGGGLPAVPVTTSCHCWFWSTPAMAGQRIALDKSIPLCTPLQSRLSYGHGREAVMGYGLGSGPRLGPSLPRCGAGAARLAAAPCPCGTAGDIPGEPHARTRGFGLNRSRPSLLLLKPDLALPRAHRSPVPLRLRPCAVRRLRAALTARPDLGVC